MSCATAKALPGNGIMSGTIRSRRIWQKSRKTGHIRGRWSPFAAEPFLASLAALRVCETTPCLLVTSRCRERLPDQREGSVVFGIAIVYLNGVKETLGTYFGGRASTKPMQRSIQALRSASSAVPSGSILTIPFIGRPVKSISRACVSVRHPSY